MDCKDVGNLQRGYADKWAEAHRRALETREKYIKAMLKQVHLA
jgi:hypothetical protein